MPCLLCTAGGCQWRRHSEVFLPVTQRLVGYRDLRTILLSWSGSHRAASIWRTRRAAGIAALARVEATIYISCRRRTCPPGDRRGPIANQGYINTRADMGE